MTGESRSVTAEHFRPMKLFQSASILPALILGAAALVPGAVSRGSPITVNQEVNLADFVNSGYDLRFFSAPTVRIANGDDVTVTFSFSGANRLLVANNTATATSFSTAWPWLESRGTSGFFTISNISISLLSPNANGGATSSMTFANQTDGSVHLGPRDNFSLDAYSSLSFTGITATFHVDSIPGGMNSYQPWFYGDFGEADVSILSGVKGKQTEAVASDITVCFDSSSAVTKESSRLSDIGMVSSVPDSSSTLWMVAMAAVLAWAFGKRSLAAV